MRCTNTLTNVADEPERKSCTRAEDLIREIKGGSRHTSDLTNERLRELGHGAHASRQVAMLEGGVIVGDAQKRIQHQSNAAAGNMSMDSYSHR